MNFSTSEGVARETAKISSFSFVVSSLLSSSRWLFKFFQLLFLRRTYHSADAADANIDFNRESKQRVVF